MSADEAAAARPSASARVHAQLRAAVLSGELAPGDRVPSERALAEVHGVNRHAVREALKRLEEAGLVRIAQGGPTRVTDWRRAGGLELLLDLLEPDEPGAGPPAELARGVLELRAAIGAEAALACAARAPEAARADAADRLRACAEAVDAGVDPIEVDARHEAAWDAVVDGAQNVAFRLALTSLVRALAAYPALLDVVRPRRGDGLRGLADALRAGEGAQAATLARALLAADVVRLDAS